MAQDAQLDFLEIVGPDGNIVSSAQWPARFGYPEPAVGRRRKRHFSNAKSCRMELRRLGLFAVRAIRGRNRQCIWLAASGSTRAFSQICRLRRECRSAFIAMRDRRRTSAIANRGPWRECCTAFDPTRLVGATGDVAGAAHYQALIDAARKAGQQTSGILYLELAARRQPECHGDSAQERGGRGDRRADRGDFAPRHGGGATAYPRDCIRRGQRAAFCWRLCSACGSRRGFRGPSSNWRARRKTWRAGTGTRACLSADATR